MKRSVLLASNFNVWREPFNGQAQAFLNVVSGVEEADLVAPAGADYLAGHGARPSVRYLLWETSYRLLSQARIAMHRPGFSSMRPTTIERDYDLFFFVCQFPHELCALNRLRGWRKRSRTAICYILETWSSSLQEVAANLRLLDAFDEVFVLNAQSIPELQRHTTAKVSHLAPAVDAMLAAPKPDAPHRSIDVYSFGRRAPAIHAQLLELARSEDDFAYIFDTLHGGTVIDWSDHRFLTASLMKRSRYFIAFNPPDIGGGGKGRFKDEQALSTRYFEGAAGGAVMLGSAPRCPQFGVAFDWPDAIIPLSPDSNIAALLRELDRDPERLETVSRRNVRECLLRHDWSHRWATILEHVGLEPTPALEARIAKLRSKARGFTTRQARAVAQ
jgi:hypothetical protein